jgi:hypothetical protein
MKKTLLLIIVLGITLGSFSQITKRNWLVGGAGSLFSFTDTHNSDVMNTVFNYTSIDLSASIGYFLVDKVALGLRPGFSSLKGENAEGGITTNTKKYGIGPFARYYFLNADKSFNIAGDICYQLGVNDWGKPSGKYNTFSTLIGPEVFFNSAVGMEVLLGYKATIETIKPNGPTQWYYTDKHKGFFVAIGFQFHLEK